MRSLPFSSLAASMTRFWERFKRYRPGYVGLVAVVVVLLIAIIAPYLTPYNPQEITEATIRPPSLSHLMGTDQLGRDEFSRVVYGLRSSLLVGLGAAGISTLIGVFFGAVSGYFGGRVDAFLSRCFEIFMMIPAFFLIILAAVVFGANMTMLILIIGLTTWPASARIMRSQVLTLKTREFVESSVVVGQGDLSTLFRHVVPNGLYPVITMGALRIGAAMITEASMAFLGLGDPSIPSLGKEIQIGVQVLRVAPWIATFPGVVLLILVLAFNLLADGLNVAFNPKN